MERFKFTKTALSALTLPNAGKRLTVYDTETPKLAVRITATGTKTFNVIKRSGSSMAWVRLGTFPDMTVEQARTEAALILGEFAAGANPAEARRAVRGELTFAETFERFLVERKKRDGTRLTEKTKVNYRDVLRIYLGPIKNSKLSDITRSEVKAIHAKASEVSHSQADRAAILVSSVFNFAADLELFKGVNPASRIQKNPAIERDRFAMANELPSLFAAIAESTLCDYFLLSLLTGARRSNVQEMAWSDIDLRAGIWRIGMTKNGTPQNVTLSPEAVAALQARKPNMGTSPFVFPGAGKTGHLVEPKTAWATILRRATVYRILELLDANGKLSKEERQIAEKLSSEAPAKAAQRYRAIADEQHITPADYDMTDLRSHDLRRTLGSWQAKSGASLAIIGKSLNQKSLQATRLYARLDLDPVRQSVNTATQAMLEAAGCKESAAIIQGDFKRA
jgi:integrase